LWVVEWLGSKAGPSAAYRRRPRQFIPNPMRPKGLYDKQFMKPAVAVRVRDNHLNSFVC